MPPTLTVEVGAGLSNSNSYITAADFDLYMERIPDAYKADYLPIGVYIKEQLGIWSTQILDNNIIWPDCSYRRVAGQSLQFPRIGMYDPDGTYLFVESVIPQFIKDATCQLAFELLKSDLTVEPPRGLLGLRVGPIAINFDTNHAHDVRVIPRSVLSIVQPFGGRLRGARGIRTVPLYRS